MDGHCFGEGGVGMREGGGGGEGKMRSLNKVVCE